MKSSRLLASATVISSLTLASRCLGLVRTMIAAAIFGRTLAMDAFVVAFTIPNLFRRLFGEGALSSAFVPVYTRSLEVEGRRKAQLLFNTLLTRLGLLLAGLTLLGVGGCFLLEWILTGSPGLEQTLQESGPWRKVLLTTSLLKVLFPYLFLICVTALLSALLNSLGHFASPAAAPVVLNLFWIAGLLFLAPLFGDRPEQQIFGVAVAVLLGGVAQVATQVPALRARGVGFSPQIAGAPGEVREIARLMGPMIFGAAVIQINVLMDKGIAMGLVAGEGAVSALYYGDRIIQFPLGLVGIAIATAAFPILSRHAARGETKEAAGKVGEALRVIFTLTLPGTVGLAILSTPVVELIYERGAFGGADSARTARVLLFYALGLWAYSGQHVLIRAFYSLKDPATPVRVATYMVGLNLLLNLALVGPLEEAGLALATAISGTLQFVVLLLLLRRRLPALMDAGITPSFLRSLALSLVMGAAVWAIVAHLLPEGASVATRGLRVGIPVAAGMGIYLLASLLLRTPESSGFLRALRRRLGGKMPGK